MEIKGTVIQSLGIQTGKTKAGKDWAKATIIIQTGGTYPKKIALDNIKSCEKFAALPIGTVGTFRINIESHEYNGRWFTGVTCYGWEAGAEQLAKTAQQIATPQPACQPQSAPPPADAYNDLPF